MSTLKPKGSTAVNIAVSIEGLIRNGDWPPGHKLPTVRALSDELGVNPNTVSAAYKQLRDAGVIETDGRRGSFVPEKAAIVHGEMAVPHGLVDLASGNVDIRLLPELRPEWLADYHLGANIGNYGDHPSLLSLLNRWLPENCGIHAEPVLFSGSLDIMERALAQRCLPGAKVLVEDPCWQPLLPMLAALRLEAVPIHMDAEGAVLPSENILNQAAAVILTPRAHSPTGISYGTARWRQWQQALSGRNALLLIDDHWGPLSRQAFPGLAGFDNEWIYSTSTSKFLGTDFRLAVAAGNGTVIAAMKKRYALGPRWMSNLLQHLTASVWQSLLPDGLARINASYNQRRRHFISCLHSHGIELPDGEGLHVWLPVHNELFTVQALAARGWAVQAGTSLSLSKQAAVRITLSNLNWDDCHTLAQDIADILNSRTHALY